MQEITCVYMYIYMYIYTVYNVNKVVADNIHHDSHDFLVSSRPESLRLAKATAMEDNGLDGPKGGRHQQERPLG